MKLIKGVWFPDYDTHFEKLIDNEGNYQRKQFDTVVKYIKPEDRELFIDVGAHVGLWSRMAIGAGFEMILAFEPDKQNYECLEENLEKGYLCRLALYDNEGGGQLRSEKINNSGAMHVLEGDDFPLQTFDKYFSFIDHEFGDLKTGNILIKIDVQGCEARVVRGMTNFIKEYKPIIIIEQWLNKKEDFEATRYCESLGMKILERVGKEIILGW